MTKSRNRPTILCVDDERQFSAMTQEYLESKGYKVFLEHSAQEGLLRFKKQPADLCVLDVKMPMKDGFSSPRKSGL